MQGPGHLQSFKTPPSNHGSHQQKWHPIHNTTHNAHQKNESPTTNPLAALPSISISTSAMPQTHDHGTVAPYKSAAGIWGQVCS